MLRLLLLIYISIHGVYGDDFLPSELYGLCPEPPTVTNFNAAKFSGIWYDVLHTSRHMDLDLDCYQLQFTALNATTLEFSSFTYHVEEQRVISVLGTVEVIQKSGNLNVKIPTLRKNGIIQVVHIQYSTIAILWSCKDLENNQHKEILVVLMRDKHPKEDIMSLAKNLLLVNHLSTSNLKTTLQLNCKKYDFDSTTELNSNQGDDTSLAPLFLTTPSPVTPQDTLTSIFWESVGYFLIMYLFKVAPTQFGNTIRDKFFKYGAIIIIFLVAFYFV